MTDAYKASGLTLALSQSKTPICLTLHLPNSDHNPTPNLAVEMATVDKVNGIILDLPLTHTQTTTTLTPTLKMIYPQPNFRSILISNPNLNPNPSANPKSNLQS